MKPGKYFVVVLALLPLLAVSGHASPSEVSEFIQYLMFSNLHYA